SWIGVPFWELPLTIADGLLTIGLRSNYVASVFAAPMMVAQQSGLIVNISARGTSRFVANVAYGAQKAGLDKIGGGHGSPTAPAQRGRCLALAAAGRHREGPSSSPAVQ